MKKNIIRHDYITKNLILLIDEFNLNKNPKWITYDEYINVLKRIISKYEINFNEEEITNYIKMINDLNEIDEDDNLVGNNNDINNFSDEDNYYDINLEDIKLDNINENEEVNIENFSDEIIEDDDKSIMLLFDKLNINNSEDKHNIIEDNQKNTINNILKNDSYFDLPLNKSIEIKNKNIKDKETIINNSNDQDSSKNFSFNSYVYKENAPKKRRCMYPKDYFDYLEEDFDDVERNVNKLRNNSKKKKKGWLKKK